MRTVKGFKFYVNKLTCYYFIDTEKDTRLLGQDTKAYIIYATRPLWWLRQ